MADAYFNGLKQIISRKKTPGYNIYTYTCRKCGVETSYKKEDIPNQCKCGGRLKFKDMMDTKAVSRILSRVSRYQCPVCNKKYDSPVDCCIAKEQRIKETIAEYNFPDRMTRGIYG